MEGALPYRKETIITLIWRHIRKLQKEGQMEDLDFEIVNIDLYGSRIRGEYSNDSDIDAVLQYKGNAREDDMFNCLHEDDNTLYVEGIEIDINPIKNEKTGIISEFLKQAEEAYKLQKK